MSNISALAAFCGASLALVLWRKRSKQHKQQRRAQSAREGTISPEEEVPIDLRRTTLVVDDINNSLKFYHGALGMKIIYDKIIKDPRDAASIEESTRWRRLVFLQANNSYIGVLGLLQYIKPAQPKSPPCDKPMQNGTAVLLFNRFVLQNTSTRFLCRHEFGCGVLNGVQCNLLVGFK